MSFAFVRLTVLVLVAAGAVAGCKNSALSWEPTPVEDNPIRTDLTDVPSEWKYMINRDTGETMPIKARLLYLSPQPGSRIYGGVIPMDGCKEGSPYCTWKSVEMCVESDQFLFPYYEGDRHMGQRPAPAPGLRVFGTPFWSNQDGGEDYPTGLGKTRPGSASGCYVSEWTPSVSDGAFTPFGEFVPGTCCEYFTVLVNPIVRKVGKENEHTYTRASASFKVGYRTK